VLACRRLRFGAYTVCFFLTGHQNGLDSLLAIMYVRRSCCSLISIGDCFALARARSARPGGPPRPRNRGEPAALRLRRRTLRGRVFASLRLRRYQRLGWLRSVSLTAPCGPRNYTRPSRGYPRRSALT
jgi:hypothetical protein